MRCPEETLILYFFAQFQTRSLIYLAGRAILLTLWGEKIGTPWDGNQESTVRDGGGKS